MTTEARKGIIGIEYALTSHYVSQEDLATELNIEPNKLKIGLGLLEIGVPSDREDAVALALSATKKLLLKYNIDPSDVGRLEVGTESNFDGSKSFKTYLLDLFPGNTSICGADTTNACYGGTNALLNAMCWLESSFWDGRYAIVVSTDISQHDYEPAIPTSGAGAVAILLGPDPVYVFKNTISHYSKNEFDFMKPIEKYPFCIMDSKKSVEVYLHAFEECYHDFFKKYEGDFQHMCFHTPFPKLPEKALALVGISKEKVTSSMLTARRNANSYTSSLYFCLSSLIHNGVNVNEKIILFSFGSGCCSSMFMIEKIREGCEIADLTKRLDSRKEMSAKEYILRLKMKNSLKNYVPKDSFLNVDGYYLEKIENYVRSYKANYSGKY